MIKKLENLITKSRTSQTSDFKSLIVLMLQLIRKNYEPSKLVPYYKQFINFLKIISKCLLIKSNLLFKMSVFYSRFFKEIIKSSMKFSTFGLNHVLISLRFKKIFYL